jgi:hypothetical protein
MRILGFALAVALAPAFPLSAQRTAPDRSRATADSTVEVGAGPEYAAGPLKRWLLGSDYRRAWTTPIRVPVLDLATVAGGLTPLSAGGGLQTKSLWFRGADGYQYAFRSVNKEASNLPDELRGTLIERLALDQTSSLYPAGPLLAGRLAAAAGVLETEPTLVLLPDDPRLGQFRERFKNTLGTFTRRATVPEDKPGFAGAREIIGTRELLARMAAGAGDDLVDAPAFLKARLFDLWIGDRDRHRGQWTWARMNDVRPTIWEPIPEDRDQAFARFDGLVLTLARKATIQSPMFQAGELLAFGSHYQSVVGSTWGGRELDRRFLPGLAPAVWDSVIRDLQSRLTNAAIDDAVRGLPEEYAALNGAQLTAALRARRDRLPAFAERFRRLLAGEVELHATDGAELVTMEWSATGDLSLRLARRDRPASPYYQRSFRPNEMSEIRLFLHGGADSVIVRGRGPQHLRLVGGGGDIVVDSSANGNVRLYSPVGTDRAVGARRVPVDRRPYRPPFTVPPNHLPPTDWGHRWFPMPLVAIGPDVGVLLGGGPSYTRYGFWKYPFAYRIDARAAISTELPTAVADLHVTAYRLNSRVHTDLYIRGSGTDVLRYHGLGNDVVLTQPSDYYYVDRQQFEFTPTVTFPFLRHSSLRIGPTLLYNRTVDQPGRIMHDLRPYGGGTYGQVGALAEVSLDARPRGTASVRGVAVRLGARVFPPAWDVDSLFADLHGEAVAYLGSASIPMRPVLALRAGGKMVLGNYPFHEVAFIGDGNSVRLGRQNRYAGDAALYGNAELRLRLARAMLIVPSDIGVFGLADVGRVFLSGETSHTWHSAFGGGIWLAPLDPRNALSLAIARGAEFTGVYFELGFTY